MEPRTAKLWAKQDQHQGDRLRLFSAVAESIEVSTVLYPGSFVDVAPSFVFPSVTYLDLDRRANHFFADTDGVDEIIAANVLDQQPRSFTFTQQDFRDDLGFADQSFDLLVSLYAGFISEHCGRYLRVGGWLLVNPSHGDAAMASIDPRFELAAAVKSSKKGYRVDTNGLHEYLIPKKHLKVTAEMLHEWGRGVAYTKSPFAYVFKRVK